MEEEGASLVRSVWKGVGVSGRGRNPPFMDETWGGIRPLPTIYSPRSSLNYPLISRT